MNNDHLARTNSRVRTSSAAAKVRSRIEETGEGYWRVTDFNELNPSAVAQTLSRLSKSRVLQRVGKGLYYHSRPTVFGDSKPAPSEILRQRLGMKLFPAGYTAANILGFTTQNPGRQEYATFANAIAPRTVYESNIKIKTRRPEAWKKLTTTDGALLDIIRRRGETSELSREATCGRVLQLLQNHNRFGRLVEAAVSEPPRVRAILGAAGQELHVSDEYIKSLRDSLNPLTRFDFGILSSLFYAKEWQAK